MVAHDVVDLTRVEHAREAPGTAEQRRTGRIRDGHLLRLALDLQLDALMCTLGAAAVAGVDAPPGTGAGPSDAEELGRHLGRWLEEDLDLTASLAAVALGLEAPLPTALGPRGAAPADVAADLLARFEAMQALLADLAEEDERVGFHDGGQVGVRRARTHCDRRVEELQRHVATLDRAAARGPEGAVPTSDENR